MSKSSGLIVLPSKGGWFAESETLTRPRQREAR